MEYQLVLELFDTPQSLTQAEVNKRLREAVLDDIGLEIDDVYTDDGLSIFGNDVLHSMAFSLMAANHIRRLPLKGTIEVRQGMIYCAFTRNGGESAFRPNQLVYHVFKTTTVLDPVMFELVVRLYVRGLDLSIANSIRVSNAAEIDGNNFTCDRQFRQAAQRVLGLVGLPVYPSR